MPSREVAREIRRRLEDSMGSDFAAKASDELCLMLAPSRGFGAAAMESAAHPQPVVIELEHEELAAAARERLESLEAIFGEGPDRALPEGVPEAERRRVGAHLRRAVRSSTSEEMRLRFEAESRDIREHLEQSAGTGTDREGSDTDPAAPFVQVCWLNSTASTATFTPALADVAASEKVRTLDAPRRLVREVDVTGTVIGGSAFRERFDSDGQGVVVAVIDSEVDPAHPRYLGRVERKANFTSEDWGSPGNHGTAVAGIVHEIAPGAAIWSYKIFARQWWRDSNDFGGALAVQRALEDGAHVANCSWGIPDAPLDGTSREARAVDTAWSLGLVLVKSAGNAGPNGATITAPADAEGVLVVGATDREGRGLGDYSSRGPTADGRERPHLVAPGGLPGGIGLGIRSTLPGGRFQEADDASSWGTSYAAPHVTGAVALLLGQEPDQTPDEVRRRVLACCSELPGLGGNEQGAGLLDLGSL